VGAGIDCITPLLITNIVIPVEFVIILANSKLPLTAALPRLSTENKSEFTPEVTAKTLLL